MIIQFCFTKSLRAVDFLVDKQDYKKVSLFDFESDFFTRL